MNGKEKTMSEPTFEQHLEAVEAAVASLKEGLPLEQALALFEQGCQHAAACDAILEQVQARIQVLCRDDTCGEYVKE